MRIVPAQKRDVPAIAELRQRRADWIATEVGSDQWGSAGLNQAAFRQRVGESIEAGHTWVCLDEGELVGTVAVDGADAEAGLWTRGELDDAKVIHRMITAPDAAGRGIGAELIQHADRIAAAHAASWLRLDAWTTNTGLHRYWQRQGFKHVRTADSATPSGALFERPVQARIVPSLAGRAFTDADHGEACYTLPDLRVFNPHLGRTDVARLLSWQTLTLARSGDGWSLDGREVTGDELTISLDGAGPWRLLVLDGKVLAEPVSDVRSDEPVMGHR